MAIIMIIITMIIIVIEIVITKQQPLYIVGFFVVAVNNY